MSIENTLQKVTIYKPHEYKTNVQVGLAQVDGVSVPVDVFDCPESYRHVVAVFRNKFRNGRYSGTFVTHDVPEQFESAPIKNVLLYSVLEEDMCVEDILDSQEGLSTYYGPRNYSFVYFTLSKHGELRCVAQNYSEKDDKWQSILLDNSPSEVRYLFKEASNSTLRWLVAKNHPAVIRRLEKTRDALDMPALNVMRVHTGKEHAETE